MKSSVFWDITPCSLLKVNVVSEEHVPSIFRVKDKAKEETIVKRVASRAFNPDDGDDMFLLNFS
jgi:hypothetical protein